MTECKIPSQKFVSGVEVDERSFTWMIENFSVMQEKPAMINSQTIEFTAGDKVGLSSTWVLYLKNNKDDNSVGIFLKIKKKPATVNKELYFKFQWAIKDKQGTGKFSYTSGRIDDWYAWNNDYGWSQFLTESNLETVPLIGESLAIDINFKIYSYSKPTTAQLLPLEVTLEKFQIKSMAKAQMCVVGSLKNPADWNDVKIFKSNDGQEFRVPKCVLMAQSPVFEAMLRSDMTEATSESIQLPDISSESFRVLLGFICTGKLLSEWSHSEILVELTNAAAKYQLSDLLSFLDMVLGKVCNLHNAGALLILAHQLSLKTAEVELLNFLKGVSTGDMVQILKGVSTVDLSTLQEEQTKSQNKSQSWLRSLFRLSRTKDGK